MLFIKRYSEIGSLVTRKYRSVCTTLGTLIFVLLVVTIFWHLNEFGGGPQAWDDLLYLDNALNMSPDSSLVHRYVHILLLRLGVLITGDALYAARLYWAVMYVTTVVAIFFSAFLLANEKPAYIGLYASGLFVSLTGLMKYAGTVYTDFTLMMFVALACLVYHAWIRLDRNAVVRSILGMLVVTIFVAALFTKETGIILFPIVAVVMFNVWRQMFTSKEQVVLIAFVVGALAVVFGGVYALPHVFQESNGILRDISQGALDPRRLVSLLQRAGSVELGWDNYLMYVDKQYSVLWLAFVLGVLRWQRSGQSRAFMVSWFIPFLLLTILTLVHSVTDWGIQPRYIYPLLPVLAIWGAFMFQPILSDENKGNSIAITILGVIFWAVLATTWGFVVLWYFLEPVVHLLENTVWTRAEVHEAIIVPISIVTILAIVCVSGQFRIGRYLVLALAAIALLGPPLDSQLWQLRSGMVQEKTDQRFRWLQALGEVYEITDESRVFISGRLYKSLGVGGRSDGSSTQMINVYYNLSREQARLSQDGDWRDLRPEDYEVVILTLKEWLSMQTVGRDRCYIALEPDTQISGAVFLRVKETCSDTVETSAVRGKGVRDLVVPWP